MITLRKSGDRGGVKLDWLDSKHTFSFADYHDPDHMGFGALRVINEDRIVPGGGFATHPHRDMEIISYLLAGELEHTDSMGNGSVIRRGEIQKMSAGTGITHSEFNPSSEDATHFFQIWIIPEADGLEPAYEQISVAAKSDGGALTRLGSRGGARGGVAISQDVDLYLLRLDAGAGETYAPAPGRRVWVQVAAGELSINEQTLSAGDGAAIEGETALDFAAKAETEALLFDLA